VGIDIERVREGLRIDELVRRFFSAPEIEDFFRLPPEARQTAFFRAWVGKEAYLKAAGGGVPAGLRRCRLSLAPHDPPAILATELEDGGVSAFSLYDLDVPDGYAGALAAEGTEHRIDWLDVQYRTPRATEGGGRGR